MINVKTGIDGAGLLEGWSLTLDDIISKDRGTKSVVIFPRVSDPGIPIELGARMAWARVNQIMEELMENDVVIVTGSGNEGEEEAEITATPALWAKVDANFQLLVGGAINQDGTTASFSQGPEGVTTWAPGNEIRCAKRGQRGAPRQARGTSCAAPMVSCVYALKTSRWRLTTLALDWRAGRLLP